MIRFITRLLPLLVLLATAAPARAAFESAYTELDFGQCLVLEADDFGVRRACPGHRGYPVWVAEGDLRFFVSYGFSAPREPAAGQTPPPFNTLGPRIEWRLSNASGRWMPVATILRFMLDPAEGRAPGEVLVVTRLGEGRTCHIAYIDARANPDANALARAAADRLAEGFDCKTDAPELSARFEAW